MTISITGSDVIGKGVSQTYANVSGIVFSLEAPYGQPGATLTNKGTVTITSTSNVGVTGVLGNISTLPPSGDFDNAGSGIFIITNTGGSAFAFDSSGWSPSVINAGLIQVTALAENANAWAVRSLAPANFSFTNSGTVDVSSYMAWGVIERAGTFNNSGHITVSGTGLDPMNAIGVDLDGEVAFQNSGVISASSSNPSAASAGVQLDFASGANTINNSGTISGEYSVFASYQTTNITIENTGVLRGDVSLTDSSGRDDVENSGSIVGNVYLNAQDATGGVYNGAHGTVSGTVYGTQGADTLTGGAGNDVFDGGGGNDTINGGGGTNTAIFSGDFSAYRITTNSGGTTTVTGPDGTDTLKKIQILQFADRQMVLGSTGETLTARAAGDTLAGGSGPDHLIGGAGNDTLIAGTGQDTLTGGGGQNTFVFGALADSKVATPDLITDWTTGDKIDLSAIDADTTHSGLQQFHFGATAGHTGDIVVTYDAVHNRTIIGLFVNADNKPDAEIWLTGHQALGASDFVL